MAGKDFIDKNVAQSTGEQTKAQADFGPFLSREEVDRLEEAATTQARGVQRRLCLLACAKSAKELSKASIEEPEAFAEMLACVEAFKEHARGLADVSEAAYFRMRIADCRENYY